MRYFAIVILLLCAPIVKGQSITNLQFVPSLNDSVNLRVSTGFAGTPADNMYKYTVAKSADTFYLNLFFDNRGMRGGVLTARADTCYIGRWADAFKVITVTPFVFSFADSDTGAYVNDTVVYAASRSIHRSLDVEKMPTDVKLEVYPNPACNKLYIKAREEWTGASILDIYGRVLQHYNRHTNEVDISTLPNGIYIIQFETRAGLTAKQFRKE